MTDVLPKKRPKGRGRGRGRKKLTDSPVPPGLSVADQDSQSCSSYDELSDVDLYRSGTGSRCSSISDIAPNQSDKATVSLQVQDVTKANDQFLDAEIEKISFSSMEMTSSPLVLGRKPKVDSPLLVNNQAVDNGPVLSFNNETKGITPLAGNSSPLPGGLNKSVQDDGCGNAAEDDEDKLEIIYIRVTHCVDPSNFSGQIGRAGDFQAFSELESAIEKYCRDENVERNDDFGCQYYVLARQKQTKRWKRAFVMEVDREADEVDVYFIDYGTSEMLQLAEVIYPMPDEFLQFPRFNYVCSLDAVKPLASVWISRAINLFKDVVLDEKLEVAVRPTQPLNVTIYTGDDKKSVADLLLEEEVAIPCISPSLMLQSPEPTEGITVTSNLVTPEQYASATASTTQVHDDEMTQAKPKDCEEVLGLATPLSAPETEADLVSDVADRNKLCSTDLSEVDKSETVALEESVTSVDKSFDNDKNDSLTLGRTKEREPPTKSTSELQISDIETKGKREEARVSTSEFNANKSLPVTKPVVKSTSVESYPVVRAKSEPRSVKPPSKAPPAFQFDQLFKASAKITKPTPKVLSSPETPDQELWKADPELLLMFGKEVFEERRMKELGLIAETDDEGQQAIDVDIVDKIKQIREGGLRKLTKQSAAQRSRSPGSQSPITSNSKKDTSGRTGGSPLGSRTSMKKNLDKVIAKADGKQGGKVKSSSGDTDSKVDNKKNEKRKFAKGEARDQAIAECLCCLQQAVETDDMKVRELMLEDVTRFIKNFNLDLTHILSTVDLEQYMRMLLRRGALKPEGEFIMELLNLLQSHDSFGTTFSFIMPNTMLEFVKVASHGKRKHDKSESFCEFLIRIIKASSKWITRSRTSVLDFTQKSLDKWLIYNKKKLLTHSTADLERLFLQCSISILTSVGFVIDQAYPDKVAWMMTELKERQLDHDKWNRTTRSTLLDLLLIQARGWDQTPKALQRQDSSAQYDMPSGNSVGLQCNLPVNLGGGGDHNDIETNTSGTAEKDSEVAARLKEEEPAEYNLVKTMLYDLHLDHLYTNFVSWGITDVLITSDEMHLGNYLVSCDFPIPVVSKMMEYLDREMPIPPAPVEEEEVAPRSLGELIKSLGLPSSRVVETQGIRDCTPERTSEKMTKKDLLGQKPGTETTPKKCLDFGSKEPSPSCLQEVAESLFKTDKEIRKEQTSGVRNIDCDESNIHNFFTVMPYSKASADIVIEDKAQFPPLTDDLDPDLAIDLDEDPQLKKFSFSDILRKKAVKEILEKYADPTQDDFTAAESSVQDSLVHPKSNQPSFSQVLRQQIERKVVEKSSDAVKTSEHTVEAPTINDWFEARLKSGAGSKKIAGSAGGNATYQKERQDNHCKAYSETKVQDSAKVADDWFFVESDEDVVDAKLPKETCAFAQPGQNARPRPSDSERKMRCYSQTSPISKDPCNNVITREDSLGLNAISDLLDSEACGSHEGVIENSDISPSPAAVATSKKPSWWRVPSPPKEKDAAVASAENVALGRVENKVLLDSEYCHEKDKQMARTLKKEKIVTKIDTNTTCRAKRSSRSTPSDTKAIDGPESVVDWMLKGSSVLKASGSSSKERPTPPRDSPLAQIASLETRSSTPDCWSDLSDSDMDDPPQTFEPNLGHEASEESCPKIDKSAVRSLVGGWVEENGDERSESMPSAKNEKGFIDGESDNSNDRWNTQANDSDNKRGNGCQDWRQKPDVVRSGLESQKGRAVTDAGFKASDKSKLNTNAEAKPDSPFEYDYSYVPQVENASEPKVAENIVYNAPDVDRDQVDLYEKKFAFHPDDDLSDSDDEVKIIMEEVNYDRRVEEREKKRILHEKYVRPPPIDTTFKGLMKPRCCICGDENHRTYECPKSQF